MPQNLFCVNTIKRNVHCTNHCREKFKQIERRRILRIHWMPGYGEIYNTFRKRLSLCFIQTINERVNLTVKCFTTIAA